MALHISKRGPSWTTRTCLSYTVNVTHSCWCPSNARSPCINSHCIDLSLQKSSSLSTWNIQHLTSPSLHQVGGSISDDVLEGTFLTHLPLDKMAAILADGIYKCIFLNENDIIPIQISLKFVPLSPIDNKASLVQLMTWRRTGDKPLPEPMMIRFNDA